jgi:TPR repeat protein
MSEVFKEIVKDQKSQISEKFSANGVELGTIASSISESALISPKIKNSNFEKGFALYKNGKFKEAFPHFKKAAKEKYPPAWLLVVVMDKLERCPKQDPKEIKEYSNQTQNAQEGLEVEHPWFNSYSQVNNFNPDSLYLVGCYHDMFGDKNYAHTFYDQAANQNFAASHFELGRIYQHQVQSSADVSSYIKSKTIEHYQHGAELGHIPSQMLVANHYEKLGEIASAKKWYQRAANLGEANAAFKLGEIFESEKNIRDARKAFLRAEQLDHPLAEDRYEQLMSLEEKPVSVVKQNSAHVASNTEILARKNSASTLETKRTELSAATFRLHQPSPSELFSKNLDTLCNIFSKDYPSTFNKPIERKALFANLVNNLTTLLEKNTKSPNSANSSEELFKKVTHKINGLLITEPEKETLLSMVEQLQSNPTPVSIPQPS